MWVALEPISSKLGKLAHGPQYVGGVVVVNYKQQVIFHGRHGSSKVPTVN